MLECKVFGLITTNQCSNQNRVLPLLPCYSDQNTPRTYVSPLVHSRVVVGQGDREGNTVLVDQGEHHPHCRGRTHSEVHTQVLVLWRRGEGEEERSL